ncbi:MAG: alpha/beta hydrolase [Pseudomonadota bacterium]
MPKDTPDTPFSTDDVQPASLRERLPTWLHVSDIQGLAQLATQGVLGVTSVAEAVQGGIYKTVAAPFGLLGSRFVDGTPGATGIKPKGITSFVYGSVKAATRLAGGAADMLLSGAKPLAGQQSSSPQREATLSAINGVLGDQLLETANPLAITMSLRHEGKPLALDRAGITFALPRAGRKILVLAHGLCMNDLQWTSGSPHHKYGHGEELAKALGYTPVYLHYNTGLHVSVNGKWMAGLLEQLVEAWPQPVEDITLLTHSMGGLVSRSACHVAEQGGMAWRKKLKNIIFLGTPHHGAPLERVGNWVDVLLGSNFITKPFAKIGHVRSSGITDLRYGDALGNLAGGGWADADRFEMAPDQREPLPLPAGVACFTVAATTSARAGDLQDRLLGDGLVPLASALGEHDQAHHALGFKPENQWVATSTNHMELLKKPEVTAQLLAWLKASPAG